MSGFLSLRAQPPGLQNHRHPRKKYVKLTVGLQGNAAPQPMSRPHIRLLQTFDAQYQRIEQPTDASEWFSPHNGMVLAEVRICSGTQPIPIRTAPRVAIEHSSRRRHAPWCMQWLILNDRVFYTTWSVIETGRDSGQGGPKLDVQEVIGGESCSLSDHACAGSSSSSSTDIAVAGGLLNKRGIEWRYSQTTCTRGPS